MIINKLLLTFFLAIHFCGFSQERKPIIVKGVVVNVYNQPILNANISIIGSSKGAKTNENGFFYLTLKQKATTIKVSHIGYYTKNKMLVGNVVNDTLSIAIQLTEKVNQLESFEISVKKIELLYNKNFVPIYDYQFYENKLLLLVNELNTIKLRLTDIDTKVLNELIVPKNTKKIYTDCFGNIHLLTNDSAYQLEVNERKMKIVYSIPIKKFDVFLKPCVTSFQNTFIFKQRSMSNDIAYYFLDKDKKVNYLKIIRDEVAEYYLAIRGVAVKKLQNPMISKMGESKASVYDARDLMRKIAFVNILLNNLIDNPLFSINNSAYIFDHPNNTCWVFDENLKFLKGIPIDYHLQKKWTKKLIIDKEQGDVYAKFERNGLCYLKKIDLTTGKIIASYKLEKHTFPINIKIKNNTAYYLYKDHFNHGQMSLFKQGLY